MPREVTCFEMMLDVGHFDRDGGPYDVGRPSTSRPGEIMRRPMRLSEVVSTLASGSFDYYLDHDTWMDIPDTPVP